MDVVFCFPNNILIDACAAAGIRPIISRMERTAVNMADAYSRVNNGNKNGVCIVQGGPGIENAFSGVAQAYADSSPLLMIPGHPGTKRHGMSSDVNLMGDVAVGMAGTDFETAAREKLGIITVIVNNGAMGGYEKNIPVAVERYGSKYVTGEYARMAESLGAYAEKITDPEEVGPAIERAKEISATGQPCVLEIITREEPVFSQYYR